MELVVLIIQHHNHLLVICNKYALLFWHHKIILGFSRLQSFQSPPSLIPLFIHVIGSFCLHLLFILLFYHHHQFIIIIICTSRNWRSILSSPPLCIFMLGFAIGKLLLKMVILTPLNTPNLTYSRTHQPLQLCSHTIIAWRWFSIFNPQ